MNLHTDPLTHLIIGLLLAAVSCGLFLVAMYVIELLFAIWRQHRHNRDS
ncbi:MAG: hypothetical protein WA981_03775 [Glaciecola sp.]